jgi:ABC-type spermidine/putrescine transport system permease subunit I
MTGKLTLNVTGDQGTAAPPRGKGAVTNWWRRRIGGAKALPLLVLYVVFFVVPQAYFLRMAFYRPGTYGDVTGPIGLGTFGDVLTSRFYLEAIWKTVELCGVCGILAVVLAYPVAYLIVRYERIGGALFILVAATMFSSAVARVLGWRVLLADGGPINEALLSIGVIGEPLSISNNFTAVVIGTVHAILPVAVIGLMPVCQAVPQDQVLAARSLGASELTTFVRVYFPQTFLGCVAIGLLSFATTAGAFTTPVLLGGGRVGVLSILMYSDATSALNYPRAAVLAVVMFVMVLVAVGISLGYTSRSLRRRGAAR